MPRKARVDAPGALHHIIVRGIERAKVFKDDTDRHDFPDRIGKLVTETKSRCFAWVLLSNHYLSLAEYPGHYPGRWATMASADFPGLP